MRFSAPAEDQRLLPCVCGQRAHYGELRAKTFLWVLGKTEVSRPYYLCRHCHTGQFPLDGDLDIEAQELSPGVRLMQDLVGQGAPFDHGRQQLKLLADIEVTTKSVERSSACASNSRSAAPSS